MAPKPDKSPAIDYDALAAKHGGVDAPVDYDTLAAKYGGVDDTPSIDSLTANPNKQGTYRLLPPSGSDIKSGIMVPYGNVRNALTQGFGFDPQSGDDTRFSHDLFTELNSKGQAPTVESPDKPLIDQYGVIPTPAPGTKEWAKRGGVKAAHFGIDSLPPVIAGVYGTIAAVPGSATGPGDIAIIGAAGAAGATEGEVWKQGLNHKFFGEKLTPKQSAKNIGVQAALGALQEGGFRAAAKPFGILADYLGFTAEVGEKSGFRMLPSEAHGTKATVFETYPKGSIFTSGKMSKWRDLQNAETEQAARKLADNVSATSLSNTGSREEAGKIIRYGIENHIKDFSKTQGIMYRQIEAQADAAGTKVPRKDIVAFAKKELDKINRVHTEMGGGGPTEAYKKQLEDIIANKNPYASYVAAKEFRSSLLAEARSQNSLLSNPEKHLIDELAAVTGDSIESGLKNSKAPQLAGMWRAANDVTREEKQTFLKNLVKNLAAKKNPEDIALVLRGNSSSAIAQIGIQETKDAMSVIPKAMIPRVQKQIILDTIYEATVKGTQAFDEGMFAKKILQIGDERGEVLFGKNWGNVKEFSELLNKMKEAGGLSAATLANPEIVKQVGNIALATVISAGSAFAGSGRSIEAAGVGSLLPIIGGAAMWKTIAAAITNPATAAKFLDTMRVLVRISPYLAYGSYNLTKALSPEQAEKVKGFVDRSAHDLITPKPATPSPASPSGGQAYNHLAVNPKTGHRIASADGVSWVDVQSGQKVA